MNSPLRFTDPDGMRVTNFGIDPPGSSNNPFGIQTVGVSNNKFDTPEYNQISQLNSSIMTAENNVALTNQATENASAPLLLTLAEGALSGITADLVTPEATDFFVPKWVVEGVIGVVALGVVGYYALNNDSNGEDIHIPEEDRVNRDSLNPPSAPGRAPTFKKDGKPVEIHHEGQNANGPFKEMHPEDHRGKGNYGKNHPAGQKPLTKEERATFNRQRERYWKGQFPKE